MVTRILVGLFAALALAAVACGGGSKPSARPTARPRATATEAPRPTGPDVQIEPKSGPPGTEVTVTGSGWEPNAQVDLLGQAPRGENSPTYQTVKADGEGRFVSSFRLEKGIDGNDLQTGRFDLIAKSATSQVDIPFLVESRRPVPNNGPGG